MVIVGAGLSGLAAAWELTGGAGGPDEHTPRVEVIEASDRVGGPLTTTTFANRTMDLGPDGFLARRPEAVTLIRELGWGDHLEAIGARGAWIWLRGALWELPTGLVMGVPTSAAALRSLGGLSWRARAHARRDELCPRRLRVGDDCSIGDIVRTKLGVELTYRLVEPMIGGIQAGRIDELSARSVYPPLFDAAQRGGSLMKALRPPPTNPASSDEPLFYSLVEGLGALPDELARQLRERGVVVRTGVRVSDLRRSAQGDYPWEVDTANTTTGADAVILATPANVTGTLLAHLDPALAALTGVTSAGAAMVTLRYARARRALPVSGTGVLVPLATPWSGGDAMMVTALTLLDRKWVHLAREADVLIRAHVGRSDDERWRTLSDEELVARVAREADEVLGGEPCPVLESLVQRWSDGVPQYRVGHHVLVANARRAAAARGLALVGNSYDGVGVPASVGSGRTGARDVLSQLRTAAASH